MNLVLVAHYLGGQTKKSQRFNVQRGDLVIALGSCDRNQIAFTLSGVSADLLASVGQHINQTRVWQVKEPGQAVLTQSGAGSNWDHIVAILRPQITAVWEPRIWYTNQPLNAPRVDTVVPGETYVFIHRYAGSGCNVGKPPDIRGVPHEVLIDVLPEGTAGPGNARETVILTKGSGLITIIGPSTSWMQVAFIVPKAAFVRGDVTWV